jgi:succinate dehydrogenase / fumarate reductase cytochrome b subunit
MTDSTKAARPEFRNIHVTQIVAYRLPLAGLVSILHRISGASLFLLMPFIIWMFDTSVTSETSFERFRALFNAGCPGLPAWLIKLVTVGLIWAYIHHFVAGLRHLWMDFTHRMDKDFGRQSAAVTLVVGVGLTLILALKLFGVY